MTAGLGSGGHKPRALPPSVTKVVSVRPGNKDTLRPAPGGFGQAASERYRLGRSLGRQLQWYRKEVPGARRTVLTALLRWRAKLSQAEATALVKRAVFGGRSRAS